MKSPHSIGSLPRRSIGAMFVFSLLAGCGYGPGNETATVLTGISIVPPSETVVVGGTATLTAIGAYSDGTRADISSAVAWASDAPATASVVASAGVVGGNAVGTAAITASKSSGGSYSTTVSATNIVTVTAATLTGITVTPLTISINRGATTIFTATGAFSDNTNGNVSGAVSWTSNDPAVATVNASGIATGVGAGTCTVTATSGAISNNATLTVM